MPSSRGAAGLPSWARGRASSNPAPAGRHQDQLGGGSRRGPGAASPWQSGRPRESPGKSPARLEAAPARRSGRRALGPATLHPDALRLEPGRGSPTGGSRLWTGVGAHPLPYSGAGCGFGAEARAGGLPLYSELPPGGSSAFLPGSSEEDCLLRGHLPCSAASSAEDSLRAQLPPPRHSSGLPRRPSPAGQLRSYVVEPDSDSSLSSACGREHRDGELRPETAQRPPPPESGSGERWHGAASRSARELMEENRALHELAGKLRLEIAAVEERERWYRSAAAEYAAALGEGALSAREAA